MYCDTIFEEKHKCIGEEKVDEGFIYWRNWDYKLIH